MRLILLLLLCYLQYVVYALPAKKTALEQAEESAKHHQNLAKKYETKSDNAYKKFQNSCFGTCFYAGKMAYYDARVNKHEEQASFAQIRVNDLKGIPRRTPTPILEEEPTTSQTEVATKAKGSPPVQVHTTQPHLSRTSSRGKAPIHIS